MARLARGEYLDPNAIQIVHAMSRCVRRAFLCGEDPYSGKSYEHRRQWIRDRIEFLASAYAIDCLTYTVLSNHFHLVLRSRPDIVRSWSDEEVGRRWLRLCPVRKMNDGQPAKPNDAELAMITSDPRRVAELRVRLSDISWWMKMTSESIAKQANREDDCTGRFFEGRYEATLILDEAAVLACSIYVDLNPIRAAMAESLENSEFTGAKDRIDDLKDARLSDGEATATDSGETAKAKPVRPNRRPSRRWERSRGRKQSGWMSPLEINEADDPLGLDPSHCGRRASLKGFLSMPLTRYLELLDWTGRQLRSDKRGAIPTGLAPILERLGIRDEAWLDLVGKFGRLFKRAAGNSESIANEAQRRGQNWMQAPGASLLG
jgi:hypothetical protein